jgi:Ni/Co efflux regulator RcnB
MKSKSLIAISLTALALITAPALAGDGKHKSPPAQAHSPKAEGRHDNGLHRGWEKQAWKRGDRIPLAYIEPRYYVEDYRVYRLSAPPIGYRWVRPMDDRYLLVELATGLVAQALGY